MQDVRAAFGSVRSQALLGEVLGLARVLGENTTVPGVARRATSVIAATLPMGMLAVGLVR